ncbi:DegT/DnrJ/EryC1/StrS family aminotransferase [bacterium]|nr:DegT/DnrJ/EryC1/StrS family aminotransferase [bacterium]
MIPVCEPKLLGNEKKYVMDCLDTNWISSAGQYIPKFEEAFSKYCEARYGVACSNGTNGLHLTLETLGVGPGDEVIIPSFTIIVSANVVIQAGARPVLVDVCPKTWCIDPTKIEEKITQRTKAIMVVHMYGQPCDMDPIKEIAHKYKLSIVEDACQAHGAEYKGKKVGAIGDIGVFSFYGNKNITTGEGGMLVTNNDEYAKKARLLRDQGFDDPRFIHKVRGFNYRMTNIQAAIGLAQTEKIEYAVNRKREIAFLYSDLLKDVKEVTLPYEASWAKNVYWMYSILINDDFGMVKDEVMVELYKRGVETRSFFYPMNQQPLFHGNDPRFPDITGKYPVSDDLARRGLYLPSGIGLTEEQIRFVVKQLVGLIK